MAALGEEGPVICGVALHPLSEGLFGHLLPNDRIFLVPSYGHHPPFLREGGYVATRECLTLEGTKTL